MRWTVGVDFGGTYVKLGAVDDQGRVRQTLALESVGISRPRAFVAGVSREVDRLARSLGTKPARLRGIGIGAPGLVDAERGMVRMLVNVPGWRNVRLGAAMTARLGCPCRVENDANLYTLGEWHAGAGARARHLVGLTLGTGIGGGLILNGRLHAGAIGAAGEAGHMIVDPGGPRCGCGARGCLEAHIGTAGILRLGRAALRRGSPCLAARLRSGARLTPALLSQAARAGDAAARRAWEQFGRWLGIGLVNLIHLLNPERVVIGGGVANAWPLFAPAMRRTVAGLALRAPARAATIVRARLGDQAGIVGGAVLVWQTC